MRAGIGVSLHLLQGPCQPGSYVGQQSGIKIANNYGPCHSEQSARAGRHVLNKKRQVDIMYASSPQQQRYNRALCLLITGVSPIIRTSGTVAAVTIGKFHTPSNHQV